MSVDVKIESFEPFKVVSKNPRLQLKSSVVVEFPDTDVVLDLVDFGRVKIVSAVRPTLVITLPDDGIVTVETVVSMIYEMHTELKDAYEKIVRALDFSKTLGADGLRAVFPVKD